MNKMLKPLAIAATLIAMLGGCNPFDELRYITTYEVQECMNFATKHKDIFNDNSALEPGPTWGKHGSAVIEIRGFTEEEASKPSGTRTFRSRLCVVGNQSIQIVSIFEEPFWLR
jgi:hypothetical protein